MRGVKPAFWHASTDSRRQFSQPAIQSESRWSASAGHHRGQFRGGGADAADDLGGAAGQVLALRREPDAPADPLHEPGAGLGLQPGQMVADGWLRVVQLLGSLGDRAMRGDRREHA
jgi:hypothetical protein